MDSPFLAPVLRDGRFTAADDGDADSDACDQQHTAGEQNQQQRHVTQAPSSI